MRVTQNQMTRQYLNRSNTALTNMNKSNERVLTQRKFLRASEDSVGASKALIIRRNLAKTEIYKDNLDTAEGIFETAETALISLSDISTTITDSVLNAVNGTNGEEERKILASQIRNSANEMVRQMNSEFADRKLFGNTNNDTPPFAYDEANGVLTFNGVDINSVNMSDFPNTESGVYVDVGLGVQYMPDGNVDKQTVIDIALNGAEATGFGVDADGDPKNLIALAFEAADAIENGDMAKSREYVNKINSAKSELMVEITNLGNKQQSVDYSRQRVESDEYSLKVAQQDVEGVDVAEEIINFKVAEMAYNATLSMGAKVIPPSIFDFIR